MKLTDTIEIAAAKQDVWAALNNALILQECIEGCTRLEVREDGAFDGTVQAKIGPVRASFQGVVTIGEVDAPHSYVLTGEGKGGVAGFAKGKARVVLEELSSSVTKLSYEAEATVGGKIAQLGARLIESTARDYADKFFTKFKSVVESHSGETTSPVAASPVQVSISETDSGLPGWLWAALLAGVMGAAIWVLLARAG
jgi:uncharacterized protein